MGFAAFDSARVEASLSFELNRPNYQSRLHPCWVIINFDTNGEHKQYTKWGIPLILHCIDCTNTHCSRFVTILKPRSILNCLHRYRNCLSSHTEISTVVCQLSAQAQIIHHHTRKIMFFVTLYQLTIVLQAWFDLLEKGLNHRQYRSTLTVKKQ